MCVCECTHTNTHMWTRVHKAACKSGTVTPSMGAGDWSAVLCKGSNPITCWAIDPAWRPFINTDTNSTQELHHERTALNKQCTYGIKFSAYLKPQNKDHNNNNKKKSQFWRQGLVLEYTWKKIWDKLHNFELHNSFLENKTRVNKKLKYN